MREWVVVWATAEPLEAIAVGVSILFGLVAVICAVKACREWERAKDAALAHADDWCGEQYGASRW